MGDLASVYRKLKGVSTGTYSSEAVFSSMKSIFNVVTVKEERSKVRIEGFNGFNYTKALTKIWGTSKVGNEIINKASSSYIEFNSFFAVEVMYTLQELLKLPKLPPSLGGKKSLLKKAVEELQSKSWLRNIDNRFEPLLNKNKLEKFSYKPLPHQSAFFDKIDSSVKQYGLNGYLLDAKPGAGKTLTSLMLGEMLEADTQIIFCPKKAVHAPWIKTLTDNTQGYKNPPGCWNSDSKHPIDFTAKYFVIHYDAMVNVIPQLLANKEKLGRRIYVNLDECHNMNDIKSKRSEMFTDFIKELKPHFTLFMSGTPIKAIGVEAIPLLRSIDPLFTMDTEERFKKIWGKNQSKAIDILSNRIGLISYVVPKEVFREGDEPIVVPVKVKLPPQEAKLYTLENLKLEMKEFAQGQLSLYTANYPMYRKEYDYCLSLHEEQLDSEEDFRDFKRYKDYVKLISAGYDPVAHKLEATYCKKYEDERIIPSLPPTLKKDFRHYKSIIKYVHLKVLGECLGTILGRRRAECNTALVKHSGLPDIVRNSLKKTIIYSTWVETIKEANALLEEDGFKTTMVYGETNKFLKTIIDGFAQDPDLNPLLATYASLSEAVPLTMANTIVMLNLPFRDKDWLQTVSRADRIGQDTQVYVYEVTLDTGDEPNISTRSKDIMEWSTAQVMAIMGYDKKDAEKATEAVVGFFDDYVQSDTILKLMDGTEAGQVFTKMR